MTEDVYRPNEVATKLGISDQGLRKWCKEFNDFLSPAAQRVTTESGTTAQRRFTDQDIAYFRRAQQLLKDGNTYEDVRSALTDESPPQVEMPTSAYERFDSASDSEPNATADESVQKALTLYQEALSGLEALREALSSKDQTIDALKLSLGAKDETIGAFESTISAKDETIRSLESRVSDVVHTKDETIQSLLERLSAHERHLDDLRLENERLRIDPRGDDITLSSGISGFFRRLFGFS
ncbi:MAG: MerR family transcriptional regulator [Thermomicrobiales bacterium]